MGDVGGGREGEGGKNEIILDRSRSRNRMVELVILFVCLFFGIGLI